MYWIYKYKHELFMQMIITDLILKTFHTTLYSYLFDLKILLSKIAPGSQRKVHQYIVFVYVQNLLYTWVT